MSDGSVGLIGLGVMGASLALNLSRNNYSVLTADRKPERAIKLKEQKDSSNIVLLSSYKEIVSKLQRPRSIILLVTAGAPVDELIAELLPLLEEGDVIADLGNSYYKDTRTRAHLTAQKGVHFLGVGISGGQEGALKGPSIMPGGSKDGWEILAPIFDKIAAKVEKPCHAYIGPEGAGHFVKMVHNGIEYADMELIAEAYSILNSVLHKKTPEMGEIFTKWNSGVLSSYLIEITGKILGTKDDGGGYLVEKILDKAEQKGTGRWTIESALELASSVPTITASVDARIMSGELNLRGKLSSLYTKTATSGDITIQDVHDALYAAKILAYAQGFSLISKASLTWNWQINLASLATIWRGGCIIRAKLLEVLEKILANHDNAASFLSDSFITSELKPRISALRKIVSLASQSGIPIPGFSSALNYLDTISTKSLPMNLVQAQRDFFGAHTFERTDKPGKFHHEW